MKTLKRKIRMAEGDSISSVWSVPGDYRRGSGPALVLAHGAAQGMDQPLLLHLARRLAGAGCLVVRFNFPYKEANRRSPDSPARLKSAWRAVLARLRADPALEPARLYMGGKSLGGRIASELVAGGEEASGLIVLGYPLHAPGRPGNARASHFKKIRVPTLFIQGTRDALCDGPSLAAATGVLPGPFVLHPVTGGDHSFRVPRSAGLSEAEVRDEIAGVIRAWLD